MKNSLRDLFNYARVSFDFDTALNDIVKICDTDTCDENAAFNNPSYHNRIYNILRSLKKEYDDKLLLMVVYCLCYRRTNYSFDLLFPINTSLDRFLLFFF